MAFFEHATSCARLAAQARSTPASTVEIQAHNTLLLRSVPSCCASFFLSNILPLSPTASASSKVSRNTHDTLDPFANSFATDKSRRSHLKTLFLSQKDVHARGQFSYQVPNTSIIHASLGVPTS